MRNLSIILLIFFSIIAVVSCKKEKSSEELAKDLVISKVGVIPPPPLPPGKNIEVQLGANINFQGNLDEVIKNGEEIKQINLYMYKNTKTYTDRIDLSSETFTRFENKNYFNNKLQLQFVGESKFYGVQKAENPYFNFNNYTLSASISTAELNLVVGDLIAIGIEIIKNNGSSSAGSTKIIQIIPAVI